MQTSTGFNVQKLVNPEISSSFKSLSHTSFVPFLNERDNVGRLINVKK